MCAAKEATWICSFDGAHRRWAAGHQTQKPGFASRLWKRLSLRLMCARAIVDRGSRNATLAAESRVQLKLEPCTCARIDAWQTAHQSNSKTTYVCAQEKE